MQSIKAGTSLKRLIACWGYARREMLPASLSGCMIWGRAPAEAAAKLHVNAWISIAPVSILLNISGLRLTSLSTPDPHSQTAHQRCSIGGRTCSESICPGQSTPRAECKTEMVKPIQTCVQGMPHIMAHTHPCRRLRQPRSPQLRLCSLSYRCQRTPVVVGPCCKEKAQP